MYTAGLLYFGTTATATLVNGLREVLSTGKTRLPFN